MFESFNTNRGQTAAGNRRRRFDRARRLVVEAMEGRLMLAATWLEFAPSNIPAAGYSLSFDSVNFISSQAIVPASLSQGGFIPPVLPNTDVSGNFVLSNDAELFSGGKPVTTNGTPYIGRWFDFGGLRCGEWQSASGGDSNRRRRSGFAAKPRVGLRRKSQAKRSRK